MCPRLRGEISFFIFTYIPEHVWSTPKRCHNGPRGASVPKACRRNCRSRHPKVTFLGALSGIKSYESPNRPHVDEIDGKVTRSAWCHFTGCSASRTALSYITASTQCLIPTRISIYPILKSVQTVYFHTLLPPFWPAPSAWVGVGPPQSASNQEDKNTVENWKAEANRFLIFVSLYPLILWFTPTQWS